MTRKAIRHAAQEPFSGVFTPGLRRRFRAQRTGLGVSLQQLGEDLRINWSTIRKWEALSEMMRKMPESLHACMERAWVIYGVSQCYPGVEGLLLNELDAAVDRTAARVLDIYGGGASREGRRPSS